MPFTGFGQKSGYMYRSIVGGGFGIDIFWSGKPHDENPQPLVVSTISINGTLPKFNGSPLKNDGWKTILSF